MKITKYLIVVSFLTLGVSTQINAQQGFGTATPDASAVIDITSTTRGLLMPRMTTVQRTAIATPATGLEVYDITTSSHWYFDGTLWVENGTANAEPWRNTDGTAATNASTDINYINGNVGIGTVNPTHVLHVESSGASIRAVRSASGIVIHAQSSVGDAFIQAQSTGNAIAGIQLGPPSNLDAFRLRFFDDTKTARIYNDSDNIINIGTLGNVETLNVLSGNVGIGTITPINKLHVTATADPLRLEGLQPGAGGETKLVIDANGVVKTETVVGVVSKVAFLQSSSSQDFDAITFNDPSLYQDISFVASDMTANTIGATMFANAIVINEAGTYEVSGSVHFHNDGGYALLGDDVIGVNIRLSKDLTVIGGSRTVVPVTAGSIYTIIKLESLIVTIAVGESLRLEISRGAGATVNGWPLAPPSVGVPTGLGFSKTLVIKKL